MIEIEIGEVAGGYRTSNLQPAVQAIKLVQGWAFSGYDFGYLRQRGRRTRGEGQE